MAQKRYLTSICFCSFILLCLVLIMTGRGPFFRANFSMPSFSHAMTPSPLAPLVPRLSAFTPEDMEFFIKTIWGEARSEGYEGMVAVAEVMLKRYRDGDADSLKEVLLKNRQFSCWNKGDPNLLKLLGDDVTQDPAYVTAQKAALTALSGVTNFSRGATHYHTHKVSPAWAQGIKPCCFKGKHRFYAL